MAGLAPLQLQCQDQAILEKDGTARLEGIGKVQSAQAMRLVGPSDR
jgi:hypothetical protein